MDMRFLSKALKQIAKPLLKPLHVIGFNTTKLKSLKNLKRYYSDRKEFMKLGGGITHNYMILSDFFDQAGTAKGHYFHQDLLVASLIYQNKPLRHIDIGSRIDGFVAHVATFRPIEILDVRKLESVGHENILFTQANLMDENEIKSETADSISCLHAIEHFGLGRYGDPLDPNGHIKGFKNIIKMLRPKGRLYISFPISNSNQVHFNAHRVFHPHDILNWSEEKEKLKIERFDYVDDLGCVHNKIDLFKEKIEVRYGCGIYTILKN